jgi:hypothetical protein
MPLRPQRCGQVQPGCQAESTDYFVASVRLLPYEPGTYEDKA